MLTLTLLLSLLAPVKPGMHPVGYRVMDVPGAKPLQVSVWYVAGDDGQPMRFRDLSADELAQSYLDAPMLARRDASPVRTRFPLIFIVQGNGQSAGDQAVLAEILASHGYEVATIPSVAVKSVEEMHAKVIEQADAVERTLDLLKNDRVVLLGHSFGARAALLVAQRRKVQGLISLDGGIGTAVDVDWMRSKETLPPILHLYQTSDERVKSDLTFLKSLKTSLRLQPLAGMKHHHFSTYGFAAAADPEFANKSGAGAELRQSLDAMVRDILAFIARATRR
jgi:pimeloyl-ACP methyl ester carboxylesterase